MTSSRESRLAIPDHELSWRFSRSSGAGGQHVNTTDTRVELTWDLVASAALSPIQKERAARRLRGRMVGSSITIASSTYRSQHRNREAAKVRLEELVAAAVVPEKPRRATRPTRGSVRRQSEAKKRRSDTKRGRRGGWD